jgi:sugar-specific transcriptional regulator TrmB
LETQFSKLQVLIDLGLTQVQARVYLALVESGPSRTSVISKASMVARPDVYRTISKLQNIGLVEKIIKKPLQYQAIPLKKGLSLLLETKTQHYEKVRAETRMLMDTATIRNSSETKHLETYQFVFIPKGKTVIEEIKSAIEKAELRVDLILSWKRFSQGIVSIFAESMEIAWKKNLKIRFIIGAPPKNKTGEQLIQFCREKPSCQMRFIPHFPKAIFGIYDEKEIFLVLKSKTDLPSSPALWSKNPTLIALAEDYFDILWLTAMKEPSQTKLA